jgi:transketolase
MAIYRVFRYVMLAFIAFAIGMLLVTQTATSQTSGQPEEFTATAIDINTGALGTLEIS